MKMYQIQFIRWGRNKVYEASIVAKHPHCFVLINFLGLLFDSPCNEIINVLRPAELGNRSLLGPSDIFCLSIKVELDDR